MTSVVDRSASTTKTGLLKASFLFVCALLLSACQPAEEATRWQGGVMGTRYHITITSDQPIAPGLESQVAELLVSLDQRFTTYSEESELMVLNRQPIGEPLQVSAELYAVLSEAAEIYRLSDGAFDPTVGPLVELWGFGRAPSSGQLPTDETIAAQLERVGLQGLALLDGQRAVRLAPIAVDLSAIAKGYAVDAVADLLDANALHDYMVEVGGELRLGGYNAQGSPWRIAIESPVQFGQVERVVEVSDSAMATSGDYHNYFTVDGVRYSHTIDPRTGRPVPRGLVSVTVLAESSMRADAMATALSVMGAEHGLALAEQLDLPVYLISLRDGELVAQSSRAFAPYLAPIQN